MRLNNIEKKLMLSYIKSYKNNLKTNNWTAKQTTKINMIIAKENAIKEGVYNLPVDYWKEIFKMEKNGVDNHCTQYYKRAREDGVKNEDFIYLWETYPVERYMLQETQNTINITAALTALDQGKTTKQAKEIVRKNFPTYGNPFHRSTYGNEEDKALPIEFVFKVNKNIISGVDVEKHKEALKEFNSFNAYIRFLARNDRLGKL